jgi:phosphatidylglycerophosphate synthase
MIDAALLPLQRRALAPVARFLAARGLGADAITVAGFAIGLAAVSALAFGHFALALALILANRLADGLDGAVARLTRPTDRGAFLDIALDFVFYALVPLGFALADPAANALPAAVLVAAFVGTGSSFLAFAVIAAGKGMTARAYPTKGIYYLGGLTEGFETIALFVLMCLLPQHFPQLAYIFAGLCAITTLTRWRQGWLAFAPEPENENDKA